MIRVVPRLALLACVTALAAGCTSLDQPTITGSGTVIASPVPVSSFSRLEVGGTFHVAVTVGSPESVTLHVDDNVLDLTDVQVSGDTLHIGLKSGTNVHGATLSADVTAPELAGVDVSGAALLTVNGTIQTASLDLSVSGAGQVSGNLAVQHARLELSGASHATLSGTAGTLSMEASGASNLEGSDLQVGDLTVDLSGASHAIATVTGTISAGVSGASSLHYLGSPTFTRKDVSGGSSIQAGEG